MNIEEIKKANTNILGTNIIYYPEVSSTQEMAKQGIKNNIENGTIFLADMQTNGQGTKGRRWYTNKENNIALTIVIYPKCDIIKLKHLTIDIAEGIQTAIKKLINVDLSIKEPNDLLLNNKKICGILTQITTQKDVVKNLLIGIGFNVNETNFPKEIEKIATSLRKELDTKFNREEIILAILEELEQKIKYVF